MVVIINSTSSNESSPFLRGQRVHTDHEACANNLSGESKDLSTLYSDLPMRVLGSRCRNAP